MRFSLLDRITHLQSGVSITAVKGLSLAEEYLQDHFPLFPVMPGVLMLEALYQASAWLVRESDRFEHPVVLLKEARSVRYGAFVKPGQVLTVSAQVLKSEGRLTTFKTQATVENDLAVSARLILERFSIEERLPTRAGTDDLIRRRLKEQLANLMVGANALAAASP